MDEILLTEEESDFRLSHGLHYSSEGVTVSMKRK
jgi:hypothetical protein